MSSKYISGHKTMAPFLITRKRLYNLKYFRNRLIRHGVDKKILFGVPLTVNCKRFVSPSV